jgi:hypothetical protein
VKAACTVSRRADNTWLAHHSSTTFATVEVTGTSRNEALTKMRDELQYRIELCPCSGVSGDRVELQVSEDSNVAKQKL